MGWEVTPSDGVRISAPENKNTEIYFPANTTKTDITYTVRFIDGNGDCGSKKITVKSCEGLPCNLTQGELTSDIPAQPGDDYFFLFIYNREGNCQFNIEELTSYNVIRDWKITEIDDGYNAIAAQINDNTGSKRTFRIKVTLDGSDIGTFDFEQQGTTPEPEPTPGGDNVYVDIVLKNTCKYDIKIIGKVKFMIMPPTGSANGIGQVYFKQKNENLYCTDITVPANDEITLYNYNMVYEGSYLPAGWPEGQSWPSIVGHLDEYNGGEISKNNTGGGNTDQLYVYTYLVEWPKTGTGLDNNNIIKTQLVGPNIFNCGTPGSTQTYTINISIDNSTDFWCKH